MKQKAQEEYVQIGDRKCGLERGTRCLGSSSPVKQGFRLTAGDIDLAGDLMPFLESSKPASGIRRNAIRLFVSQPYPPTSDTRMLARYPAY
jgi:hypothetical protein